MAPNPPALAPVPNSSTSSSSSTRKRQAEDGANGAGPAKRAAKTPDVVFRLLVPAGKIGKVIGKQGSQIKKLREETAAHIKIADPVSTMEDRAVLISSRDEAGSEKTCAEVALLRVATILLEDSEGTPAATGPQHQGTRLLIAGSQAGSLIGKGGASIKEIRESSSASVRILPSDQLPFCSAAAETDRLVQISGDLPSVQKAIELVAAKLRENPPKEPVTTSAIKPAYFLGIDGRTGQQVLLPHTALSMYGFQPAAAPLRPPPIAAPSPFTGLVAQAPVYTSAPATVLPKVTSEMSIPSALMGGIIGRGGANISQIRNVSGASIKVHGSKEGSAERTIFFEGTQEQVTAAQGLVQAFLNGQ